MRTLILIFVVFIPHVLLQAQNFVPNPSFEDTIQCPTGFNSGIPDQLSYATGWYIPTHTTSDYFNTCNQGQVGVPQNWLGWEFARTGVAYAGIYTANIGNPSPNYREYIQAKLIDTLIAGAKYSVSFYVSRADSCGYACNSIGAYFSQTAVTGAYQPPYAPLPYTPQIANTPANPLINKNGWTLVADTFTAVGGELYITIGNFKDAAHSDTVLVSGGSYQYRNIAYYYIDDILVEKANTEGININDLEHYINIYPNPGNGIFQIVSSKFKIENIEVYNMYGKKVYSHLFSQSSIDISNQPDGIYFIKIKSEQGIIEKKVTIKK